jgi:formylmethanofuran dehydrogenase subunit C
MTLQLTYQGNAVVPVEVEGITPDAVGDLSPSEIELLPIQHGNEQRPLAEFFSVSGDAADGQMRWEGDLSTVHWIGAKMTGGRVHVAGSAGRHVGSEMQGGEIVVDGDASDWVGGEMHGGFIRVRGRAGHLAGSAYRGSVRGMTGGLILIHGDAGNEVGHTMRRGLVAIGGRLGDLAGFNMLAGSVLCFGEAGIRHGAGMRRGTLGFFGGDSPEMLPSFRRGCRCRPGILSVIFAQLRRHDFPLPADADRPEVDLYHGDMIAGGRGEILVGVAN